MNNYREEIFRLITSFCGQQNVITIPAILIHYTGDRDTALFLSQVLYWDGKTQNPDGWFYKTYNEWEAEICMNEYEVRKAKNKLVEMGILETRLKKANGSPVVHYRLKKDRFSESILQFLKNPSCNFSRNQPENISESITEITTETTTENGISNDIPTSPPNDQPVSETVPYDQIISEYHDKCPSLPKVKYVTDKRRKAIRSRWRKYSDLSVFTEAFKKAEASDFLSGRNGKWTGCNFDWLMNEANMIKVLEGNYDNKGGDPNRPTSGTPSAGYGQGSKKSEYAGYIGSG